MKSRCYNVNNDNYKSYGYRGITVCDQWLNDSSNFINWAIQNGYSETMSLDRIDVNRGYSPSNCRWADIKTQNNNKRNNHIVSYNGQSLTVTQWGELLGISRRTLTDRLKKFNGDMGKAISYHR